MNDHPPPLPAVRHRIEVPLSPEQAFDLFVHQISRWWPFRGHSCRGDARSQVRFEPRVGGAVTEVAPDGTEHAWGRLTDWQPPAHFAMTWHPAQSAERATRLAVRFVATGQGCAVELQHDGFEVRGDQGPQARGEYDTGWAHVLGLYRAAAAAGASA